MGTSRQVTERQLALAKEAVKTRAKELEDAKSTVKCEDDPHWRRLDARARQLGSRLRKIAEVETVNAQVEQAKIDNAAKRAEEKAAAKTAKKAKPAKETKEKGKGEKGEAKPEKKKEKSDKAPAKPKK